MNSAMCLKLCQDLARTIYVAWALVWRHPGVLPQALSMAPTKLGVARLGQSTVLYYRPDKLNSKSLYTRGTGGLSAPIDYVSSH